MRAFLAALFVVFCAGASLAQTSPGLLQPGQIGANYASSPGLAAPNNWMASGTTCPTWQTLGQLFLNTSGAPANDVVEIWDGSQCLAIANVNASTHGLSLGNGTATGSFAALGVGGAALSNGNLNITGQYQVGGVQIGYGNGVAGLGTMAAQNASNVSITGASALTGLPGPVNPSDAATKQYVDSVATGLTVHTPVAAATTVDLGSVTYNNGSSGVGATLTNAGTQAVFSVDGISPAVNSRIMVKNESTTAYNGIYTLTVVGSSSTNWVLTRALDANTPGTGNPSEIGNGTYALVTGGTTQAGTAWVVSSTVTTIGTSPINWTQFSAASTATACGATGQIQFNSAGVFGCNSTFVYTGGNVGIGTATPGNALVVLKTAAMAVDLVSTSGSTELDQYPATGQNAFFDNETVGSNTYFRTSNAGLVDTVAMTLLPNGNVGIGTTTPGAKLDVESAGDTYLKVQDTVSGRYSELGTNQGGSAPALIMGNSGNVFDLSDNATYATMAFSTGAQFGLATNGAILVNTSWGTPGQCLLSGGTSTAATWGGCSATAQTDFYVATSGTDSGSCTSGSPCRTITYATQQALNACVSNASATVHLAAGTWNESVNVNGAPNCSATSTGGGSHATVIYDGAGSGSTVWNGSNSQCGTLIANQAANVGVENMTMEGTGATCQSTLYAQEQGIIQVFGGMVFAGSGSSGSGELWCEGAGSQIELWNSYSITAASAPAHAGASQNCLIEWNPVGITVTVSASFVPTSEFFYFSQAASIFADATWSGYSTSYSTGGGNLNGTLFSGNFGGGLGSLPGNHTCSNGTGAQCL